MVRHAFVAAHLLLFTALSPALAQQRGGPQRGGDQIPAPGTMLPAVSVYDEQGEKISTSSLQGSYTVLVFGCLT